MCKGNSADKNEARTWCVRYPPPHPPTKQNKKTIKEEERIQHGMCKGHSPDKKEEASMGCLREAACIEIKTVRDV